MFQHYDCARLFEVRATLAHPSAQQAGGVLQGIKPSTLAGLLCALVTPFQLSRPEVSVGVEPSEGLQLLVEDLSADAVELASAQAHHGILCPIEVDLKCGPMLRAVLLCFRHCGASGMRCEAARA